MTGQSAWEIARLEFNCTKHEEQVSKRLRTDGAIYVCVQCVKCGRYVKSARKKEYDLDSLPWYDEELENKKSNQMQERFLELKQKEDEDHRLKTILDETTWWTNYSEYLNSEHWKQLRRLALMRDGFMCQNCFRSVTEETAHVHHKTYAGYDAHGYSFAFEVITLCKKCHLEYHKKTDGSEET